MTHGDNVPMTEELLDVEDPYSEDARSPNLLYFATLAAKPWQSEGHEARLPVLVTETIGLARRAAPISVLSDLPRDAALASIRVVTPDGEELPSQARVVDRKQNTVDVTFVLDLMEREQVPLFVYYGGQGAAEAEYSVPRAFNLREGRDFYHLENERLRVELDKESGDVRALIVAGGSGRNQLGEFFPYVRSNGDLGSLGGTAQITEDGPIRKTLSYEHRDMTTEISLYRRSDLLYYQLVPKSAQGAHGMVVWTPGGDCRSDYLYYETAKDYFLERRGIKRAKIRYAVAEDLTQYQFPDLKEGWLAFEDQRGEVGGELLLLEDTRKPTLLQHGTGYQIRRSAAGPRRFHGALLAAKGNYETVRKAYIAWMNPPVVTLGKSQRKLDAEPKVPVFGDDFVRMLCCSYGGPDGFQRANERSAEELVRYVSRLGANCLGISAAKPSQGLGTAPADAGATGELREDPFLTKELLPAAHRRGMAVEVGFPKDFVLAPDRDHGPETPSSQLDPARGDRCSSNVSAVKYLTKYRRGAAGNREPVITRFSLFATGGVPSAEATRRQIYLQLLWGSNSLCGFSLAPSVCAGEEALSAAKEAYDVLNYSGLGELLVKAQPFKFVGILCDGDAFPDGPRDSEYGHRAVGALVRGLGSIPTDIVFSKYLSSLNEDGYRVLIIPDAPALSTANAELIRKYVEEGGSVIVEAEGLNSEVIRDMAKVSPKDGAEATVGQWQIRGIAAPLAELECTVRSRRPGIENLGAKVLAECADGGPAFTSAKCGKGTVIYSPLRISESLDRAGGPAAALSKLIVHLAGPLPFSVAPEDAVVANALVNREKGVVVLAVYHYTLRPREDVWVNLRPEVLGLPEEYEVTEFLSGSTVALNRDGFVTELTPYEFRFYVLAAPKRFSRPRADSNPVGGIAYSRRPGMKFLKRPVDQIDGTSAGKEGKPKSLQEVIENLNPEDAMGEKDLEFEE